MTELAEMSVMWKQQQQAYECLKMLISIIFSFMCEIDGKGYKCVWKNWASSTRTNDWIGWNVRYVKITTTSIWMSEDAY